MRKRIIQVLVVAAMVFAMWVAGQSPMVNQGRDTKSKENRSTAVEISEQEPVAWIEGKLLLRQVMKNHASKRAKAGGGIR